MDDHTYMKPLPASRMPQLELEQTPAPTLSTAFLRMKSSLDTLIATGRYSDDSDHETAMPTPKTPLSQSKSALICQKLRRHSSPARDTSDEDLPDLAPPPRKQSKASSKVGKRLLAVPKRTQENTYCGRTFLCKTEAALRDSHSRDDVPPDDTKDVLAGCDLAGVAHNVVVCDETKFTPEWPAPHATPLMVRQRLFNWLNSQDCDAMGRDAAPRNSHSRDDLPPEYTKDILAGCELAFSCKIETGVALNVIVGDETKFTPEGPTPHATPLTVRTDRPRKQACDSVGGPPQSITREVWYGESCHGQDRRVGEGTPEKGRMRRSAKHSRWRCRKRERFASDSESDEPAFPHCATHVAQQELFSAWYREFVKHRRLVSKAWAECADCQVLHMEFMTSMPAPENFRSVQSPLTPGLAATSSCKAMLSAASEHLPTANATHLASSKPSNRPMTSSCETKPIDSHERTPTSSPKAMATSTPSDRTPSESEPIKTACSESGDDTLVIEISSGGEDSDEGSDAMTQSNRGTQLPTYTPGEVICISDDDTVDLCLSSGAENSLSIVVCNKAETPSINDAVSPSATTAAFAPTTPMAVIRDDVTPGPLDRMSSRSPIRTSPSGLGQKLECGGTAAPSFNSAVSPKGSSPIDASYANLDSANAEVAPTTPTTACHDVATPRSPDPVPNEIKPKRIVYTPCRNPLKNDLITNYFTAKSRSGGAAALDHTPSPKKLRRSCATDPLPRHSRFRLRTPARFGTEDSDDEFQDPRTNKGRRSLWPREAGAVGDHNHVARHLKQESRVKEYIEECTMPPISDEVELKERINEMSSDECATPMVSDEAELQSPADGISGTDDSEFMTSQVTAGRRSPQTQETGEFGGLDHATLVRKRESCSTKHSGSESDAPSIAAESERVSELNQGLEHLVCVGLDARGPHLALGLQLVYDCCTDAVQPSRKLVAQLLASWRGAEEVRAARLCHGVLTSLQRRHQVLRYQDLWRCLCKAAVMLETSSNVVQLEANGRLVEFVAQALDDDLGQVMTGHGDGNPATGLELKRSLVYKWLDPVTESARIREVQQWMASVVVRNVSGDVAGHLSLGLSSLSRLLRLALEVCVDREKGTKCMANNFCSIYAQIPLWAQRKALLDLVQPAELQSIFVASLMEERANRTLVSENCTRTYMAQSLSVEKITKYFFCMGTLSLNVDGEVPTSASTGQTEEHHEELLFLKHYLLRSHLETIEDPARSAMSNPLEAKVALQYLETRCYRECPGLKGNNPFQQALTCIQLLVE